jgi:hypothetical protein
MRRTASTLPHGVVFALVAVVGCGALDRGPAPVDGFMERVDDQVDPDGLGEELEFALTSEWVERYEPGSSFAGFTLVLYKRRLPVLLDPQGRIAHSWPEVRAVGRARLGSDGRLLVIGVDDLIKEYDWNGNLTWAYALPREEDLPHHDVITLANGHTLVLAQETATRSDYLHEVDRKGRVVWEWWPRDHLERHFPDRDRSTPDPTHINSLFELGPNRWHDEGDERFRPGNILLSARNLDSIFIVDRGTGGIVWRHGDGLDWQHEAQMIPSGVVGEGLVVVFNNGTKNRNAYRRSEILVVHPIDGRVVWRWSDPTFFTTVAGTQQVLPNGNLLISSSEGGRVFEITPDKQKVWEWIPPFLPMRALRYPPDHCPQLEALGAPDGTPVARPDRQRWVDIELGQFAFRPDYRVETLYGLVREVLRSPSGCRELLLPVDPVIQAAYGFDEARLDGAPAEARFTITARRLSDGATRTVLDATLTPEGDEIYRDRYIAVRGFGLQRVDLCVAVEAGEPGEPLHPSVFLTNPRAYSRQRSILVREWRERELSRREQSLRQRQLEAIGYVQ